MTPDDSASQRLRPTLVDSERLQTTSDDSDSERFRPTPGDSERLQTVRNPDNAGQTYLLESAPIFANFTQHYYSRQLTLKVFKNMSVMDLSLVNTVSPIRRTNYPAMDNPSVADCQAL
uniref:Uncharacterized protein n=1 Tax=Anopheles gambiae TaxID=7165 RepID=A0A0E3W2C2_ANOGA